MIRYAFSENTADSTKIKEMAKQLGVMEETARLLFLRGIDTVQKAKKFLSPSKRHFYSPWLLRGMKEAVERIALAKELNQSVVVFGDYDADGVCATTILFRALNDYGVTARLLIPEREDGYGLNFQMVSALNDERKIDLIITVDCGISDAEKIEQLKSKRIDVIVTDHHEPPEILPNCITINPKISGQDYPFSGLCGAGVAYKLAFALIGDKANLLLDYVALATVSDSMDLIDENRDLVAEGLKLFNSNSLRQSFKYLLGEAVKNSITAQTLAYTIAPRINAGGRMGDALSSLKLFVTDSQIEAYDLAVKLNAYNMERQAECERIYREAKAKIIDEKAYLDQVIMVYDASWNTGFVGIVAAKLVEEFCRPVIVFAGYGNLLKGSARSVDGVSIHQAIQSAKDVLVGFGGHSQAAGVTVSLENFHLFKERLNAFVKENYATLDTTKKICVEWEVDQKLSIGFAREIDMLEPFGVGNRRPLFAVKENVVNLCRLKADSPHCNYKSRVGEMLYFNGAEEINSFALPLDKWVVFEINLSTFKNKEYLKGYVKNVVLDYSDLSPAALYAFGERLNRLPNLKEKTVEKIDELPQFNEYGTLYAASELSTLQKFPQLSNLAVSFYKPENRSLKSSVVVMPTSIPLGYDRVVYLDTPSVYFDCKDSYQIKDDLATVCALSCDREDFTKAFTLLCSWVENNYANRISSYQKQNSKIDGFQLVYCAQVFFELGFFYLENGLLKQNKAIKNSLDNSIIYRWVNALKGGAL